MNRGGQGSDLKRIARISRTVRSDQMKMCSGVFRSNRESIGEQSSFAKANFHSQSSLHGGGRQEPDLPHVSGGPATPQVSDFAHCSLFLASTNSCLKFSLFVHAISPSLSPFPLSSLSHTVSLSPSPSLSLSLPRACSPHSDTPPAGCGQRPGRTSLCARTQPKLVTKVFPTDFLQPQLS